MPTPVLDLKSPFLVLFNKPPDYQSFKTFGCACYPCLRPYQNHKFQYHSTKCTFLGNSESHKGYKCLSSTGRVYTRHVIFNEQDFPFKTGFLNTRASESPLVVSNTNWLNIPTIIQPSFSPLTRSTNQHNSPTTPPTHQSSSSYFSQHSTSHSTVFFKLTSLVKGHNLLKPSPLLPSLHLSLINSPIHHHPSVWKLLSRLDIKW